VLAQAVDVPNPDDKDVKHLPFSKLFQIDCISAFTSAAPCAAIVCAIDQAVTQNASGTATLKQS
jgi:hypothetical protein